MFGAGKGRGAHEGSEVEKPSLYFLVIGGEDSSV